MHITFHGGGELQRRWFDEALRSMMGDYRMTLSWVPVIFGYPIEYIPVIVDVRWDSDPDPSVHNEWGSTENGLKTFSSLGSVSPFDSLTGQYARSDDDLDPWAVVPNYEFQWSEIRIKSDLHTKGEALYKDVVRHELGHVIMGGLANEAILALSATFGYDFTASEALAWFEGEGESWGAKGKEMIAETIKDLFHQVGGIGDGRYSFNRARRRLRGPELVDDFTSPLAPWHDRLEGSPSFPWNESMGAIRSTRWFLGSGQTKPPGGDGLFGPDGAPGGAGWAGGATRSTYSYTDFGQAMDNGETVLWRHRNTANGNIHINDNPSPEHANDEVAPHSYNADANGAVTVEIDALLGEQTWLSVNQPIGPAGFSRAAFYTDERFSHMVGLSPTYVPSPGSLSVDVTDGEGRSCWMPHVFSFGDDPGEPPLTAYWREFGVGDPVTVRRQNELSSSDWNPNFAPGRPDPEGWIHNPDEPLEPVFFGVVPADSPSITLRGQKAWHWRPRALYFKLPLTVTIQASGGGTYLEQAGPAWVPPTPEIILQNRHIPAFEVPWPYLAGTIQATPTPPGMKERKPVTGAPSAPLVIA